MLFAIKFFGVIPKNINVGKGNYKGKKMVDFEFNKVIFICIIMFFVVFSLVNESLAGDYYFHLEMSRGGCIVADEFCATYPPLTSFLFNFFSFNERVFVAISVMLAVILIPLLLFFYTKNVFSVLLYFGTSIWADIAVTGTIAQGLTIVLFLLFLLQKDLKIRLMLLLLSVLTHNLAPFLLLLYWLLEVVHVNVKAFFLAFPSGFNIVNPLLSIKTLVFHIFTTTNPLIFVQNLGLKNKHVNLHFYALAFFSLLLAVNINRAFWVTQIILIILVANAVYDWKHVAYSVLWIMAIISTYLVPPLPHIVYWTGALLLFLLLVILIIYENKNLIVKRFDLNVD